MTSRKSLREDVKPEEPSPEELERFFNMVDRGNLGFDPWSRRVPLFDLHVPTPLSTLRKDMSLRDCLKHLRLGLDNQVSNITSMFRLARYRSIPWNPNARSFSLEIFRTSSTKPGTYLAPLRQIALQSYKRINNAIATNNGGTIAAFTDGTYKSRALARMRSLHPSDVPRTVVARTKHVWRLHSLASPVKCVSFRCHQGHFGRTEPLIGTRYVVQACMKLDTWQSLSTYTPSGSSEPATKRVLEYLVFEKRMYYDEPWVVRDQLWEGMLTQSRSVH